MDIAKSRFMPDELDSKAQDRTILVERKVLQCFDASLNGALANKRRGLACAFVPRRLNSVDSTKQGDVIQKVLDYL